jgi:hypothetical protein
MGGVMPGQVLSLGGDEGFIGLHSTGGGLAGPAAVAGSGSGRALAAAMRSGASGLEGPSA